MKKKKTTTIHGPKKRLQLQEKECCLQKLAIPKRRSLSRNAKSFGKQKMQHQKEGLPQAPTTGKESMVTIDQKGN